MSQFKITGRKPIAGSHRVPGNKNAALPMLAATLLTDEPVTLENVPDIADVARMLDCVRACGASVSRDLAARTVTVHAARLRVTSLDPQLARKIRTSILLAGPLLARLGTVTLPPPGGDDIGRRRLDSHFDGFRALGTRLTTGRHGSVTLRVPPHPNPDPNLNLNLNLQPKPNPDPNLNLNLNLQPKPKPDPNLNLNLNLQPKPNPNLNLNLQPKPNPDPNLNLNLQPKPNPNLNLNLQPKPKPNSPASPLRGADILLDEASVTATENLVMAAVLAEGRTVIYNAACEPHVQNLCTMLVTLGAKIGGIGTNRLVIDGVTRLHGGTARVGSDYVEAVSYMVAAAVTGGELMLTDVDVADFAPLAKPLRRFGLRWTKDAAARTVTVPPFQHLKLAYDFGDTIPSVADGPWPMFPSDLVSILIVLATQARGTCIFHEKMFESRLYFVDHLIQMGAKIVVCDPHRCVVTGPTRLRGATVTSPDIRAGIALVIAALCARGETRIMNAESVDRGYAAVESELGALGADIRRE